MKVIVYSSKPYDIRSLEDASMDTEHALKFIESRLDITTALLAKGYECVCAFVNDELHRDVLSILADGGVKLIALRCAGFNNIDMPAAKSYGITVVRVPAYSPHAVAEHTVALLLALSRKLTRAYNRVREGNFSLEGLMGLEIYGRTVGVIGTGRIGVLVAKIMKGFGCEILAYDTVRNPELEAMGVCYSSVDDVFRYSNIITLHCPLLPETRQIINKDSLKLMRDGVIIVNTSRGKLIDSLAVVNAMKSGKVGGLALDVYEEESELFFEDRSDRIIQDDVFSRLLSFPNVIITGHQAFFTDTALRAIAETTIGNISEFEKTKSCGNTVVIS